MSQQKKCLACGNNQTSHFWTWLGQTLSVITSPLHTSLSQGILSYVAAAITNPLMKGFISVYKAAGVLQINTDPTKTVNLRGKVLWQEAIARGISMHSYIAFGKPVDLYCATVKNLAAAPGYGGRGKKIYFNGLPRPLRTVNSSEWWMDDKFLLKQLLQKNNIPVARGGSFSRFEPLFKKFNELDKPVIIKPRLGSRGRHTTTHIYKEADLRAAFDRAKQLCYWVIMEEHLIGSVDRATIIDGKLAGVLAGFPPRITGDGVHTIAELVEIKNKNKPQGISDVVISEEHINFLSRQELNLQSVLPVGKTIDLLLNIGVSYGGSSAEVTSSTHLDVKKILEEAAKVVGDPLIGFDFIIPDRSQSPHQQKWGIIECNGLPFINLHYFPIEGTPNPVGRLLWDYVEKNIEQF